MGYYNTTNQKGIDLVESKIKASSQSDKVMDLFKSHPIANFTPDEVLARLKLNCPLTSIRRTMTDLTGEGLLRKTNVQRKGSYGSLTYAWTLVGEERQGDFFQ